MDDRNLIELIKNSSLNHIAIIMDGNGRWAQERGFERSKGHSAGMQKVIEIIEVAKKLEIKYLSLYAFSTENWKRPQIEVSTLFSILNTFIKNELNRLIQNNVRLTIMGDISKLPYSSRKAVEYAINKTKDNNGLTVNIGLNYGSRDEIAYGIRNIVSEIESGNLNQNDINETTLSKYLYTSEIPDPDLLIRTGGEKRLSNFMLYQIAYSEFDFPKIYWPDYGEEEFKSSILNFINRNRRFGGLNEK
ncbi:MULTISPECIES: isoprenyl transferase [Helcococcus]|uniref:Isoprenyl transferase n=1 Tax=Helcococcus bovis TaxID=3153252 RepID=A0ABW9F5X7_9FIRM